MLNTRFKFLAVLLTLAFSSPLHATPEMVTLVAKDGTMVQLTTQAASLSGLIRKMVDADATHIPLPGLRTDQELKLLVIYLNAMVQLGKDMPEKLHLYVRELSLDDQTTLLNGASYLEVPPLIHASAYCIAKRVTLNNSKQLGAAIDATMHTVVTHYLLTKPPRLLGDNSSPYHREALYPLKVEHEDYLNLIRPEHVPPNRQATAWAATEDVVTACKSLDGTKVALVLRDGSLKFLELQSGTYNTITKLGPSPFVAYAVANNFPIHKTLLRWSDDGHKLVTIKLNFVQVYEKIDGSWQKTAQFSNEANINDVVWDDFGNTLIFATKQYPACMWEYLHGQWLLTGQFGNRYSPAQRVWLCPRGKIISALCEHDNVRVWWHRRPERIAMRRKYFFTIGQALELKKAGPQI